MYESSQVNTNQKLSLKLSNVTLEQALDRICGAALRYEIVSNNIVIKKKSKSSSDRSE
ncbi:STN domain-containing protein [Flavobacterium sp. CGRL2]